MKKTIIFAIILMPVIVLGILLFSGDVVGRTQHLYVEQVEFVESNVVLDKNSGEDVSKALLVNVYPMLASNKEVEFWSADESIATIDENGVVTSVGFGETFVYVKSKENGAKVAYCKVIVTSERVHYLEISNPIDSIYVGETYILNVDCFPKEAKDVALTFSSSNPDVLEIGSDGTLVPKAKGRATISAVLNSNTSVCTQIEIEVKIPVQEIYVENSVDVVSGLSVFDFPQVKFFPDGSCEPVVFESSDSEIATVDEEGKIVFVKPGSVEISAKIAGTNYSVSKKYRSTMGFVDDVLFSSENKTVFDFEEYQNSALPITWSCSPEGANLSNVWISSNNENVLKIQDNNAIVVGGGTAQITLNGLNVEGKTVSKTLNILINRKVSEITFGIDDFVCTTQSYLDLNLGFETSDANEKIVLSVSNSEVAEIKNGRLEFKQSALDSGYCKVSVTATASGVSKTVVVAYVSATANVLNAQSETKFELSLPLSSDKEKYQFRLVDDFSDCSDVEFKILEGNGVVSANGYIFTLENDGIAKIGIFKNQSNEPSKVVEIEIVRLVEKIQGLKIYELWQSGNKTQVDATKEIYSACSTFEVEYSLFPETATLKQANVTVSNPGIADFENGVLTFNCAGMVILTIQADNAPAISLQITSTLESVDSQVSIQENLTLNKDTNQTKSIWELINISPVGASKDCFEISVQGETISLDENGLISPIRGGQSIICVEADVLTITNGRTFVSHMSKTIKVLVEESATSVDLKNSNQVVYSESFEIDLFDRFEVLSKNANKNNQLTFSVDKPDVAIIGEKNGKLTFLKPGKCLITASLPNGETAQISVIYAGKALMVEETKFPCKILKGTTVVIVPSAETLANAKSSFEFVVKSGNSNISEELFVTVNGNSVISFGETDFVFECVDKLESVEVTPKNSSDFDIVNQKNITGLKEIQFYGSVIGVDEKYIEKEFSISGNATISKSGVVQFTKAGSAKISFTVKYASDVVGGDDISKTANFEIQSSFGKILSLNLTQSQIVHNFDNENEQNNILDISNIISVVPSQIAVSAENLSVLVADSNIATSNGLELTFSKGGNVSVLIQAKEVPEAKATLIVSVERSATAIYMNGKELSETTVSINKSSFFITPTYYPTDANKYNIVAWEVVENSVAIDGKEVSVASVSENRVTFNIASTCIAIKFCLKNLQGSCIKEYVVRYQTSTITFEVDIDSENFIVPADVPFSFISKTNQLFSVDFGDVKYETIGDGVYKICSSIKDVVVLSKEVEQGVQKTLISTSNISEISGVKLKDLSANGQACSIEAVPFEKVLTTASKSVEIEYNVPVGYDKYGNLIGYTISTSNTEIATVNSNTIEFLKAGAINVIIKIQFEDSDGEQEILFEFGVESTFETVSDFELDKTKIQNLEFNNETNTFNTLIYDNLSESDKIIDLSDALIRVSPAYGKNVDGAVLSSSNQAVALVSGCQVQIVGSGRTTITILWGGESQTFDICVDKYIDGLEFVKNQDAYVQVVTKSEKYQLDYRILNSSTIQPTLCDVEFSSPDCTIVNGIANLLVVNKKYIITITASYGKENAKASATLEIIRVGENVEIIDIDENTNCITIQKSRSDEAEKQYILNNKFGKSVVQIQSKTDSLIEIQNSSTQIFTALCGGEGVVSLSNGKVINCIVEENVEKILFNQNIPTLTALGSKEDAKQIEIDKFFGATIYPSTARNSSGLFEISVETSDSTVAGIEILNNKKCLVFYKQGEVVVSFSAGGVVSQKTIRSTMGYAYSATLLSKDVLTFDKQNPQNLTINQAELFTVLPQNAYKYNPEYLSSNTQVFEVENQNINLVGGGRALLEIRVMTGLHQFVTLKKEVYVTNRATQTLVEDLSGNKTGYQVLDLESGKSKTLSLSLLSSGVLSDYVLSAETNTDIIGVVLSEVQSSPVTSTAGQSLCAVNYRLKITANSAQKVDAKITIFIEYSNKEKVECASLSVKNYVDYDIKTVENQKSNSIYLNFDSQNIAVLFPNANNASTNFDFEVIDGSSATVNSLGEIQKLESGKTVISVKDSNGFDAEVAVYVFKKATITLKENDILTAKSEWQINHEISILETLFAKTITYVVDDESVASVSGSTILLDESKNVTALENGGKVLFKKAGSVKVTITISNSLTGEIEDSKTFTIRSTFGSAESFDISTSYCAIDSDSKTKITVSNIIPADCTGTLENLEIEGLSSSFQISNKTESGNGSYQFEIVGKTGGTGTVKVSYLGCSKTISVAVAQVATGIEIQYNNMQISEITTIANSVTLNAVLKPIGTVANKDIVWSISRGDASVNNGVVTLNSAGKVVVMAQSGDGRCSAEFVINYLKDIINFDVIVAEKSVVGDVVYFDFNQNNIVLNIKTDVCGVDDISKFSINGQTLGSNNSTKLSSTVGMVLQHTLSLSNWEENPFEEKNVSVSYASAVGTITKEFTIIREGVQKIEFEDAINNSILSKDTDSTYGLQSMRLFGNKSYYGGVQTYYKMKLLINGKVETNSSILSTLDWSITVANVGYSYSIDGLAETTSNSGIVYLDFSRFAGGTIDEIYSDNFSTGSVTITAKTKSGKVAYSYTFHIVTGVNIYDKEGYSNAGTTIVLQTNFGHDDQKDSSGNMKSGYVYLDTYVQKNTIYGNGHMLNLAHKHNNRKDDSDNYTEKENKLSVYVQNLINVNFYGANASADRSADSIQFLGIQRIAYCELYYMMRSVEHTTGQDAKIKNTSFASFRECGIIKTVEKGNLFLENIVMFDTGSRAIEVQCGNVYLSGDIKIYNFQNKKSLSDIIDIIGSSVASNIISEAKSQGVSVSEFGLDWVNMVGISTKRDDTNIPQIYYSPIAGSTEGATTDLSALNMRKIQYKYIVNIDVWVFTNINDSDAIKVKDEYSSYTYTEKWYGLTNIKSTMNTGNMTTQIGLLKRKDDD